MPKEKSQKNKIRKFIRKVLNNKSKGKYLAYPPMQPEEGVLLPVGEAPKIKNLFL